MIQNDSIVFEQDTVETPEPVYGLTLTAPSPPELPPANKESFGLSYILTGLFLVFIIIGIRFRNTHKYVGVLVRDIIETRIRHNVFDETVRETSFLFLLNLLWCSCAGVILYSVINYFGPTESDSFGGGGDSTIAMLICMGVGVAYSVFMCICYLVVGNVFSDGAYAKLWVKGFAATQGLMGFIYFPLALLVVCWPQNTLFLLWIAAIVFILAKIVFLWKGLRIFFAQISSWLLFLYYLCSLEIVPLILAYTAASVFCGMLS